MGLHVEVVGDLADRDPGFVGRRLVERHGARLTLHDRDALPSQLGGGSDLVILLGSGRSAHDPGQAQVVQAESRRVREALRSGTPVLGICYGGQLLAHALGGLVHPAEHAEIGWYAVEPGDHPLCPAGPWSQFHTDAFTPPTTATALGKSSAGCQGFIDESAGARALGWQFHPEVTAERFIHWTTEMRDLCVRHDIDPDRLIEDAPRHEARLREASYALTDVAVDWLLGR